MADIVERLNNNAAELDRGADLLRAHGKMLTTDKSVDAYVQGARTNREAAAEIARLRESERAAFRRGVEAAAAKMDAASDRAAHGPRPHDIPAEDAAMVARFYSAAAAAIRAIEEEPT